jgi:hypothetical protein
MLESHCLATKVCTYSLCGTFYGIMLFRRDLASCTIFFAIFVPCFNGMQQSMRRCLVSMGCNRACVVALFQ